MAKIVGQFVHGLSHVAGKVRLLGKGGRGEKIRTYNFKENRITDHRIGFTLYQLQNALAGDLDPVIDALTEQYQIEQLAHASSV